MQKKRWCKKEHRKIINIGLEDWSDVSASQGMLTDREAGRDKVWKPLWNHWKEDGPADILILAQ